MYFALSSGYFSYNSSKEVIYLWNVLQTQENSLEIMGFFSLTSIIWDCKGSLVSKTQLTK